MNNSLITFSTFLVLLFTIVPSDAYISRYIWASDGTNGFLLDLITLSDSHQLRLATYTNDAVPTVYKQNLPLDDFSADADGIKMGGLLLSNTTCLGTVNEVPVDLTFELTNRSMKFLSEWVTNSLGVLPKFQSTYGDKLQGRVGEVEYAPVPTVYSMYDVPMMLDYLEWIFVSALSFEGTDLQIEIIGSNFFNVWLGSSYIRYNGTEIIYNEPTDLRKTVLGEIGHVKNGIRNFEATIETEAVRLQLTCEAPASTFALLEYFGSTMIHTSVLGNCRATDLNTNLTYYSKGTSLLEVKGPY